MAVPIEQSDRKEIFLFARKLYFQAKVLDTNEVVHVYSSKDIAKMIRGEFHESIPDSTIRRWTLAPDKDFGGRSWTQEWDRLLTIGNLKGYEQSITPEQSLLSSNSAENNPNPSPVKSPAEQIIEMKKKSTEMVTRIVTMLESIVFLILQQLVESYQQAKTKKQVWNPPLDLIRALHPYYADAKRTFQGELPSSIDDLSKKGVDREEIFGSLVPLKDPMARERVRTVFMNVIKTLEQYQEEKEKDLQASAKVKADDTLDKEF